MQKLLKSREYLRHYAEMRAVENMRNQSMDCGECAAPSRVFPMKPEAKQWGLCDYHTAGELLLLKGAVWVAMPVCTIALLCLNWGL